MLCKAVLPSETLAHKAQRILAAHGYPCEIIRSTSRKEGCGYGLRIAGDCEAAHSLLIREGVPVKLMTPERGNP
jgi:hypothetical protein